MGYHSQLCQLQKLNVKAICAVGDVERVGRWGGGGGDGGRKVGVIVRRKVGVILHIERRLGRGAYSPNFTVIILNCSNFRWIIRCSPQFLPAMINIAALVVYIVPELRHNNVIMMSE